ncbi:MAG: FtsX-like permease family protein [Candidatus Lokiarchaeota archaeon]|nr:FtsX-like permease family protein [Candidatus Lokiarchaeota archaeon]MBD3340106.1 FtsX-like permease family protein [Candidatus Lokiarchaeota archaeon]
MMVNLTIKDLLHYPTRLILVILGLSMSLLMVHVSFGMVNGTLEQATLVVDNSEYDCYVIQKNVPNIMISGSVSDDIFKEVKEAKSVKKADQVFDGYVNINHKDEDTGSFILGYDPKSDLLEPWDLVEGNLNDLKKNSTIIVDVLLRDKFFPDLTVGDKIKVGDFDEELKIVGFCENFRKFGNPGIWTHVDRAKDLLHLENESIYIGLALNEGYTIDDLKDDLEEFDDDIKIVSAEKMKESVRDYLLNDFGVAASLGILAVIGFTVAMVIISISMYQSVSDKLPELVSLKALGADKRYVNNILIGQTSIIVTLSFVFSTITALLISPILSQFSTFPIILNIFWTFVAYGISIGLGILCSLFSIRKVHKTDPGIIFRS